MPLSKIQFKPGVNRENTRYTTEGGWYECDKIRFRQGNPEKIGGWTAFSSNTFVGVCRALWNWITLAAANLVGAGTNLKYYINQGSVFYDITPIRSTVTLTNPFTATNGSAIITVVSAAHGCGTGDFVTYSGAGITGLGGNITATVLTNEFQVTVIDKNSYTITVDVLANATDVAGSPGGGTVVTQYQVNVGPAIQVPLTGWGAGGWGLGTWGFGQTTANSLQLWSNYNFGEDLIYGPRGGGIYYWRASIGTSPIQSTITIGVPALITLPIDFYVSNGTAISLISTGALPTGLTVGPIYYVVNSTGNTFNLATSSTLSATLSSVVITGNAGQFSCAASSVALVVGQSLTISGTYGGTGSIAGYANPTIYYIVATNGSTTFTLSTTPGGSGVTTTAGTPTGLTYTLSTVINTSGAQSGLQYVSQRGINLALLGDSDTPIYQNYLVVSDASRFVLAFGTNDYGSTTLDPMLIRWSDQENPFVWKPAITNQAGSIRLSHGSQIVSAIQSRQEIVVFTDQAVYSLQYLGPPFVWKTELLGDNISVMGPNALALASGVIYWMGVDKFYMYDGRVQTLNCDLRRYVFQDLNIEQREQVYAGTNEAFNEIWWFYCSSDSTVSNRYVIFNYLEKVWYYGTMGRTAWLDSGLLPYPIAATYNNLLVNQEDGIDDLETGTAAPINAYISSSEFDIGDGHNFGFVYRIVPDLTFSGSTNDAAQVTMTLYPLENSGSGVSNSGSAPVIRSTSYNIVEKFTGQIYTRVRGRQMIFKIESTDTGTTWQLGAPRIDIRPDGRR
jgi:hypothetical protein